MNDEMYLYTFSQRNFIGFSTFPKKRPYLLLLLTFKNIDFILRFLVSETQPIRELFNSVTISEEDRKSELRPTGIPITKFAWYPPATELGPV